MQNMSDYYLARRFVVQSKQVPFTQGGANGAGPVASNRLAINRTDFKWGMGHLTAERIEELVLDFRKNALSTDDASLKKHKVASREILYNQLAEAYALGLSFFCSIYNQQYLDDVLCKYNLHHIAKSLISDGRYNKWNAITALLYGEWEQVSEVEADGLAFKRDRSAEKYGQVLWHLDKQCVPTGEAAQYIASYTYTEASTGKTYRGMIAIQRAYAHAKSQLDSRKTKPGHTSKQIEKRNRLIARAESADLNDDVFEIAKPAQLSDAVEYVQLVAKSITDSNGHANLLVVGYESWERAKYESYAYNRGRKAEEHEKAAQAEKQLRDKSNEAEKGSIASSILSENDVSELLNLGYSKDQIISVLKQAVSGMKPHIGAVGDVEPPAKAHDA